MANVRRPPQQGGSGKAKPVTARNDLRRPGLFLILPIVLVGMVGTAVALVSRSSSDSAFVFRQENLTAVTPAVLEHFVASAPDPRPGTGRHPGMRAHCSPQGVGELRNPWACTVQYPIGRAIEYRVVIDPTGQVHGANSDASLTVYGCCVGYRPSQ